MRRARAVVVGGALLASLAGCSGSGDVATSGSPPGSTARSSPSLATGSTGTTTGSTGTTTGSTGGPTGSTAGTTASTPGPSQRWGLCTTRLAYAAAVDDVESADAARRAHGLEALGALPVPAGHEEGWKTYLAYYRRWAEIADGLAITDPDQLIKALAPVLVDDPVTDAIQDLEDWAAIPKMGIDPPCDPVGLPAGFGCDGPEACTDAWARAAHQHDQGLLDRLGQPDIPGTRAPSAVLRDVWCGTADPDGDVSCRGASIPDPGSTIAKVRYGLGWARTADGRWYGVYAHVEDVDEVPTTVP